MADICAPTLIQFGTQSPILVELRCHRVQILARQLHRPATAVDVVVYLQLRLVWVGQEAVKVGVCPHVMVRQSVSGLKESFVDSIVPSTAVVLQLLHIISFVQALLAKLNEPLPIRTQEDSQGPSIDFEVRMGLLIPGCFCFSFLLHGCCWIDWVDSLIN